MPPVSRGFRGRRRAGVDPSRVPPGQYGRNVRAAAVYVVPAAAACTWTGKTPNWP